MEQGKEPHSISLKVLRLSRPSLAEQFPLPPSSPSAAVSSIDPRASLSHPSASDPSFILAPLLSLPTGFGTAFVGSTFACTICANNELPPDAARAVTDVRIAAEVSTPTQTTTLKLQPEDTADANAHADADADGSSRTASPRGRGLAPAATLQRLLRFELREEGAHTLAVSVTYETTTTTRSTAGGGGGGAVKGRRTRSFRKLYQFAAVPCLSVRTKATDLLGASAAEARDRGLEKRGERFALEAQLENLTDGPITLEGVVFEARRPFGSVSLNWDVGVLGVGWEDADAGGTSKEGRHLVAPTLSPGAVTQVCYLITEDEGEGAAAQKEITKDGRYVLGALSIKWRGAMGEPGVLSTGWLTSRRR